MCHLTKTEIQKLHYKFSYPLVQRLHHLLVQARHNPNLNIMLKIKKMCKHCQRHANASNRFRFKFQNNVNFNYTLLIDIIQLGEHEVLHIVNEATKFKAARLIQKGVGLVIAKAVFNIFKLA